MLRRYLFGPVPADFAAQKLHEQRRGGSCLTFNSTGDTDLRMAAEDDWDSVRTRFPAGWQPDFLVLNLGYTCVPACLWSVPLPLVGLAQDWPLLWHLYRRRLRQCELVLTDTLGVETLRQEGIGHARVANLFGCDRSFLEEPWPGTARDIDILFVGNFNPAVQRDRLPWLARPARLARRWNVVVTTGVFAADYRRLLGRARIVFNRSIRGECNQRVFEAAAAGALLFQESGNREVAAYFRDRVECVYYDDDNLEMLLTYYLEHEDERRTIADAAHTCVGRYTFASLWEQQVQHLDTEMPALLERIPQRFVPTASEDLRTRTWQILCGSLGEDPALGDDLWVAGERDSHLALHHALGLLEGMGLARGESSASSRTAAALHHFRAALACEPGHVLAGLNAAEALGNLGQTEEAIALARSSLETLEQSVNLSPASLDACHFPPAFDVFRVEWERAAWTNAGQPQAETAAKRDLLRWRLHGLLAEWTGQLEHYRQAQQARPDLWPSRAALGCALGRAGLSAEAVEHLRAAVVANPFDAVAARALYQARVDAGDHDGQRQLIHERRDLAAAVKLLTPEAWFAETSPLPPASSLSNASEWLQTVTREQFRDQFGAADTERALCGYTNAIDTAAILTLLARSRPRRILEIGTALGHMTANFTEWSGDDAVIYTLGTIADWPVATAAPQRYETPDRQHFGQFANAFGKAAKVFFIAADSLTYDFRRLPELDFAFIDGAHDFQHVLSDTMKVYDVLRPGGYLVWHDFSSPAGWVEVRQALEAVRFREPIVHIAGTAVAFLCKAPFASEAAGPLRATTEPPVACVPNGSPGAETDLCLVWEGAQQANQSLAVVNRAMCLHLLARGHAVSVLASAHTGLAERTPDGTLPPAGYRVVAGDDVPLAPALAESFYRPLTRRADVHVRHQWPPRFTPPPAGHWVIAQPWEYGSMPKDWVESMTHQVDEVWACSQFVRDCYVAGGIPAEQVHVIPCGVDCARFHPQVPPLPLPTRKRWKFLFVGGTIHRKGIDLLLEAYARTFTDADEVCLVIKDMGVGSFYKGQTAERQIAGYQQRQGGPEIVYLDRSLSEPELAGLYTACDCLVHPYRGEGFGLPMAEAMACGLPVIVTGIGAAVDFCDEDSAYLIPAERRVFAEKRVGDLETVDYPWLAEPDGEALARHLRHVFEHAEEARAKGRRGRERIEGRFTWGHAALAAEERIRELRERPVRRLAARTPPARTEDRPRVSLCMIVKNEEEHLPACLESAAGLVDEIVVVDTGSMDRTQEIAAGFGARVFSFPWVDSFAAARNESLRHATGQWIFWLDADDRLDASNRQRLQTLFAELPEDNAAFVMKCLCLPDPQTRTATVVDHVRLFRNTPDLRWEYRVHEQILPSLRRARAEVRWSDVVIQHVGYQDTALRQRKLARDRRLLQMESVEKPNDPFILFNLGSIAQELGQLDEALSFLRRSLELSQPGDSIVRKLYALLSQCHRRQGQDALALTACRKGREFYPDDIELLFQEGIVLRERGERAAAKSCWSRLLQARGAHHFASVDTGLCGYKARHNLAHLHLEEGELTEAESQWRAALAEQSDFTPARLGLGEVRLRQGRWAELEQTAAELAGSGWAVEGELLRARGHMARHEFPHAYRLLEKAIALEPQSSQPRRVLSHALLQEGKDWQAAERALRDVLTLDPGDGEARHNLTLLLERRNQASAGNGNGEYSASADGGQE